MRKDPLFLFMCLLQGKTGIARELFENDETLRKMIAEEQSIGSLMLYIWNTYEQ